MRPYVDADLCISCGVCEAECPSDPNVFEMEDIAVVANPDACIECGACVDACPTNAIELK